MNRRPAQYVLRFDDFCPTMSRTRWHRFAVLIEEFRIRPILSVVPDNHDPELDFSFPDPGFWEGLRRMEKAGATIAMQGYRHVDVRHGRSISEGRGEFAGASESDQREWIHAGLEILRQHGLSPRLFVAPGRRFDRMTLRALARERLNCISEGQGRCPYEEDGVLFLPQQLDVPRPCATGLWTIRMRSNCASNEALGDLAEMLQRHSRSFVSFEEAICAHPPMHRSGARRLLETIGRSRV